MSAVSPRSVVYRTPKYGANSRRISYFAHGRYFRRPGARWAALGWVALYLLAVLTPLFLAYVVRPQTDHGVVYEVGKGFALLGITILALQFVLHARLSRIEKPFGLDMLVLFHRFMGVFATVLLLTHPVVLVLGGHEGRLLYSPAVE